MTENSCQRYIGVSVSEFTDQSNLVQLPATSHEVFKLYLKQSCRLSLFRAKRGLLLGVRSKSMASTAICFASFLNVVLPCYRTVGFLARSTTSIRVAYLQTDSQWTHGYGFAGLDSPHWTTFASSFKDRFPCHRLVDSVNTSDVKPWRILASKL